MTRKTLNALVLIILTGFVLSLSSCNDLFSSGSSGGGTYNQRTFWTLSLITGDDYTLQARLLGTGTYCNVWVDTRSNISASAAQNLANRYDNIFRPNMLSAFGTPLNFNNQPYSNPLALIDRLGDNDGKLAILLVYDPQAPGSGYFWSGDLYVGPLTSNHSDIIKIFVGPDGHINEGTVVHEVQHAMNYATGLAIRGSDGHMDTWINEGLSAAAEWIGTQNHNVSRVAWFNDGGIGVTWPGNTGRIAYGNNFFMWDNHRNYPDAIYDDYATVYLFFNWMRVHAGENILEAITTSTFNDYRAVTNAMNNALPGLGYSNWNYLLQDWMYANLFNEPTGIFGYLNDPVLRHADVWLLGRGNVDLYPGEAVFSIWEEPISSPTIINRWYYNHNLPLDQRFNNDNPGEGSYMLTYNFNTDNDTDAPFATALLSTSTPEYPEHIRASSLVASNQRLASRSTASLGEYVQRTDRPVIDISDLRRRLLEEQNAE